MENNTFNISELYVGKVVSVYIETHELEVYVPKLMPTLNYGFSNTVYSIDLQSEVLKTNTLICKPNDFKERLPDIGSLVHVRFLDNDIKKIYWIDFDPFGTNTYMEFEKTGNEKTLHDFMNLFDVDSNSLTPKDFGVFLGSREIPFEEIFGKINSDYVIGLDQKLQEVLKEVTKVDLWASHSQSGVTIVNSSGDDAVINGATDRSAGVVTTLDQAFAGNKVFMDNVNINGNILVSGSGIHHDVTIKNIEPDSVPITIDTLPGADGNLQEWKSNGELVAYVDKYGNIIVGGVQLGTGNGSYEATVTALATNWEDNLLEIEVMGVTTDTPIIINAAAGSKWYKFGMQAIQQDTNTIVFSCDTTPNEDITFSMLIGGIDRMASVVGDLQLLLDSINGEVI
jgi:hypothetical protein